MNALLHTVSRLANKLVPLALLLAAAGCASLPADVVRQPSSSIVQHAAPTSLQRTVAASTPPEAAALSGFRLLPSGPQALDARLALAQRAEATLDVQAYLIADDVSGRQLLGALRDAARRGVRVRLLVDDLHAAPVLPLLAGLAAQPNAQVRLYNPLPVRAGSLAGRVLGSLHELERINHRMHNKLFIADNTLALAGGRNLGDEYFMRSAQSNFIDMDVLASGPVVGDLAGVFDGFWNSERAWPVLALEGRGQDGAALRAQLDDALAGSDAPAAAPPEDVLGRRAVSIELAAGRLDQVFAPARVLADAPDKARCDAADCAAGAVDQALDLLRHAETSVALVSPYFVPGDDGLALLRETTARGVKVQLLTNSLGATDEPLVHAGYARYRPALLDLGIELRELSPTLTTRTTALGSFGRSLARLHAKVAVIDRRQVLIGSLNLDPRSRRLNTEVGLLIDSPALARELARLSRPDVLTGAYRLRLDDEQRIEWLAQQDDGGLRVLRDEPDSSAGLQLKLGLLSLLVGEDWL